MVLSRVDGVLPEVRCSSGSASPSWDRNVMVSSVSLTSGGSSAVPSVCSKSPSEEVFAEAGMASGKMLVVKGKRVGVSSLWRLSKEFCIAATVGKKLWVGGTISLSVSVIVSSDTTFFWPKSSVG